MKRIVAIAVALGTALAGSSGLSAATVPKVKLTRLQPFATSSMAMRPNDPVIYVTELEGWVDAIDGADLPVRRVLDLRKATVRQVEQGLLGLTFSPDGSKMYVLYTGLDDSSILEEYSFSNGVADPLSRRRLLDIPRQQKEHNGGQLAFGPDGMLYVALGDGGGGYDYGKGHLEGTGNAQSLETLLGKILRINPTPSANAPYTIPPDNPFANGGGRPEIWAYGLRNPWRFSFDRETGDLWIGEVGQEDFDEIDFAPADAGSGKGVNYGWNLFEGRKRTKVAKDRRPTGGKAQRPLLSYAHNDKNRCTSLIGGFVYRGSKIPELQGAYIYGDFCAKKIRWLRQEDGKVVDRGVLNIKTRNLASFGQDHDGELYVLSLSFGLFRIDPA